MHPAKDEFAGPPSDQAIGMMPALLLWLRGNAGKPSLASVQDALAKLELIRTIRLPAVCLMGASPMSSSDIGGVPKICYFSADGPIMRG